MSNRIYQFKIELLEITPTIWRRILVPEKYSFWDLHVAIQDAMGWQDYHLHNFSILKNVFLGAVSIGIPDNEGFADAEPQLTGWETPISDYFDEVGMQADYEYDFGDDWQHKITFEAILEKEKGVKYPRCIDGARACPPEDCGGSYGYESLLEIIANPKHKEYKGMLSWLGGKFDPEKFNPATVKFDNPKQRFKLAFQSGL